MSCLDDECTLDLDFDEFVNVPPMLADLPADVFAPAADEAPRTAAPRFAVIPAFGTLAYLRTSAEPRAVAAKTSVCKPVSDDIPAFGLLAYLRSSVRPKSAIEVPHAVVAESQKPERPFVLVDLPDDVFAPAPGTVVQKPLLHDESLAGTESPPQRLGHAVELTRRAVSAWVSVLIGPALVDVSRR